jgi:hypothetical protein
MNEEWRPVVGFEDRYQISNLGNLKSNDYLIHYINGKTELRRGRIRKANIVSGYRYFLLVRKTGEKRVSMKAARMVAMAFIPNPENKPCVDHIDTNRLNDSVENLRWVTHSENNLNPITRERYVEVGRKRIFSKETREKIGNYWKGKHLKESQIKKIRSHSRKVEMLSQEGMVLKAFDGASFAQEETGVFSNHIRQCCKGERLTAGGYKWRYII